ncbi:chaplin [Yinghuangia aomiensis]|uniref:chaplin n=1 Tax=Yinghuangia aomiensis TaxID=676205 RepID=UPI0031ED2C17
MNELAKKTVVAAAMVGGIFAMGGTAYASAGANGAAVDSPGVLSGNLIQVPVHVPVNVCGNTVNVIGALNPAVGNTCINAEGPVAPPMTPPHHEPPHHNPPEACPPVTPPHHEPPKHEPPACPPSTPPHHEPPHHTTPPVTPPHHESPKHDCAPKEDECPCGPEIELDRVAVDGARV